MLVKVEVEFRVESVDGEDVLENTAWSAADLAVWNFLALVKESTQGGEVDDVTVHVDGFGECVVSLANQ